MLKIIYRNKLFQKGFELADAPALYEFFEWTAYLAMIIVVYAFSSIGRSITPVIFLLHIGHPKKTT